MAWAELCGYREPLGRGEKTNLKRLLSQHGSSYPIIQGADMKLSPALRKTIQRFC